MKVPMKVLLQAALKQKYAVPAFNVNSMEMVQAVFFSASKAKSPVIIQVSPSALEYSQNLLPGIVFAEAKNFPKVNFALHLDHGRSFAECKNAMQLGFSSVMMDASINYSKKDSQGNHPSRSFAENAKLTKQVVLLAHSKGISVEGEIGTLGGIEDFVRSKKHLTDPADAGHFAEATGIDALAIAIGTSHGAYKFKHSPRLDFNVLKQTKEVLPDLPLVLHGASSVPKAMVARARKAGLKIGKSAKGLPDAQVKKAISLGVCKVNIDTDARLAFMAGILESAKSKTRLDLRSYFGSGKKELERLYLEKIRLFGSRGKY